MPDYSPTESARLVAEAKRHDAAATPGPWESHLNKPGGDGSTTSGIAGPSRIVLASNDRYYGSLSPNDGDRDFIATARTAWPATAHQLEEAGKRIAELEAAIDKIRRTREFLRTEAANQLDPVRRKHLHTWGNGMQNALNILVPKEAVLPQPEEPTHA